MARCNWRWASLAALIVASQALAQKASDPNKALLLDVKGEVTAKGADGAQTPVAKGAEIARGQELSTGVDSEAKLAFADGSVMVVHEMTQVQVADLLVQGSRQNVTVAVKLGEVSAQVNPKKAYQTDFKVSTPSGTASVQGTVIREVSYHPVRGMEVNLESGSLLVTPPGGGGGVVMAGGDHCAVPMETTGQSTYVQPPGEFQQEESRLHTEPPVTAGEHVTVNTTNQPQGVVPSTTTNSVTSAGGATFAFRFQKQ